MREFIHDTAAAVMSPFKCICPDSSVTSCLIVPKFHYYTPLLPTIEEFCYPRDVWMPHWGFYIHHTSHTVAMWKITTYDIMHSCPDVGGQHEAKASLAGLENPAIMMMYVAFSLMVACPTTMKLPNCSWDVILRMTGKSLQTFKWILNLFINVLATDYRTITVT